MKYIASLLLLLSVILCSCYGQSHHSIWGQVNWNERPIYNTTVVKTSSTLQIVTVEVPFPRPVSFS